LNPRFVEDPCDGDLDELLSPPEMEREVQLKSGRPRTELQKLQDSFRNHQKDAEKVVTMPEMPSFGFQIPTVASATKAKHPSELEVAVKNGDAHVSPKKGGIANSKYAPKSEGVEAKDEVVVGKEMGRPLMITPDTYKSEYILPCRSEFVMLTVKQSWLLLLMAMPPVRSLARSSSLAASTMVSALIQSIHQDKY